MALIQTPSISELAHQLLQDDNASWTYEEAHAIVEYLDELSYGMDEDIEFCPVAIRCDVNSYSWEDLREYYSNIQDIADAKDNEELLEVLQDHTSVITHNDETVLFFTF